MIHGIGADIVETARMEALLERFGERLARRILTDLEWGDYMKSADRMRFLSKRFAAKEAFSKAVGTGLRHPVTFGRMSVVKDELGKPSFAFDDELSTFLEFRGISNHHLSISDEKSVACAFVVLEGK